MREKISVYFIVKNEAERLPESLQKAKELADELIVVDSGSTDGTLDIAHYYGARVVHNEWKGFAAQKSFAASLCQNDWVLDLDADEVLSDELITNIRAILEFPELSRYAGFKIRWVYVSPYPGHPMVYSPDQWIIRFYNRKRAAIKAVDHSNNDRPQIISGEVGQLKGYVHHKSVITLTQLESKYTLLSSDQAADYAKTGRGISNFRLVTEFPLKFLKYYLIEGNFRNGWYGFAVSMVAAYRNFMRFAKARELAMLKELGSRK